MSERIQGGDVSMAPGTAPDMPSRARHRVPWAGILAGVVIFLFAIFLLRHWGPAISEPDDNGYYAQGSLLARTGETVFRRESDAQYIGMHWLLTPQGTFISRYPPGLAVVIAAIYAVAGWRASVLVNPMLAVAGLVGMYLLGKRALGVVTCQGARWWAVASVVFLAMNPEYVHHALSGDSHMGVACVLIWGIYYLVRWAEEKKAWMAFVAGVILGCVPTIRYADGIVAAGVGVFLLMMGWHLRDRWSQWLAAFAGALVPVVPLMIRNKLVMGSFFATGYSLTNEDTGFGLDYFREHAAQYLWMINIGGVGLFFLLGVAGMIWMIRRRDHRQTRQLGIMIALMALPMMLLYMAYYWGPSRNAAATMRFLMPTFSLYILAGLWMGRELLRRKDVPRAGRIALLGLLIAVQLIWGSPQFFAHAVRLRFQKRTLAQATTAIDRIAQPGDVVVTTGLLLQQLDFVRLWKVVDGNVYLIGMPGGRGGMRGFGGGMAGADGRPSPGQAAKAEAQRELYGGDEAQREQKFMFDIKKWAGDKGVWLVGAESDVMSFAGDGARVTIVRRVTLAASPTPIGPRGLFGPGGFPGGPGGFGGGPPGRGGSMGMPPQEVVIARWELQ